MAFTQVALTGKVLLSNSTPAAGATINLTLNAPITDGTTIVAPEALTTRCATDGSFTITVNANDDSTTLPTGTYYSVVIGYGTTTLDSFNVIVPHADAPTVNLFTLATLPNPNVVSPYVSQITAGSGITLSPAGGTGTVQITSSGGTGALPWSLMPAPSGDATGATDTAAFKAALNALPTVTVYATPSTKGGATATYHVGTIFLQGAPADVWTDQVSGNETGTPYYFGTSGSTSGDVGNIGPFVSVLGPGHNACVIKYLGSGDCLRQYNTVRPSSDTFDTLSAFAGKIDGFTIDGTSASAGACGLHSGDHEGVVIGQDFWVTNFTGGSISTPATASKGIWWDNAVSWTENITARANLYNCTVAVYFGVTTGDLSYMYSSHEYKIYAWPNQYCICLDKGANFDNGAMRIRANLLAGTSTNNGACLAFGTSTSPNNRIADSELSIQAEVNAGIPGGTFFPYTIYKASAYYNITRTIGAWSFGNGTWQNTNLTTTYPISHTGPIYGDTTLQGMQETAISQVQVTGTPSNGQVLVATSGTAAAWQTVTPGSAAYPWTLQGLLGWSFDEASAASSGVAPAASCLIVAKVAVPTSITITNIIATVTSAGSGLTSGSQCVGVVYDSSGNLLGQTGDQSTVWTSTGAKTMALTSQVSVTGGSSTFIYVGILVAGTTIPQFERSGAYASNSGDAGSLRFARTSATYTSPPSTASFSTSTYGFFFGLS